MHLEKIVKAGQIKVGDTLMIETKEGVIRPAKALDIVRPGVTDNSDGEEIIIDRGRNVYFITSLLVEGSSWVKEAQIVRGQ